MQGHRVTLHRGAGGVSAPKRLPIVKMIQAEGSTMLPAIATALNERGGTTLRRRDRHDSTVRNLLARAG
jgi:hypothetical protein